MRRVFSAAIVLSAVLLSAVRIEAAWDGSYVNGRFGWSVTVPADFGMDPAPDNDDGRRFFDREGCSVLAWGEHNVLEGTVDSEMEAGLQNFDSVTYRKKGDGWFVLSGHKDGNIVYVNRYVGAGALNTLRIEYPAGLREEYDALVTEVVRSFKPEGLQ